MKSVLKKILFISLLFVGKLYAQQELLWREAVRNSFVLSRVEDCKAVFWLLIRGRHVSEYIISKGRIVLYL